MKVIDLLNKIANGEEVPIFRYLDRVLRYNKEEKWFDDLNDSAYCRSGFGCDGLNDELELVEEIIVDKKIEKFELPKFINEGENTTDSQIWNLNINLCYTRDKINEIIDYLEENK